MSPLAAPTEIAGLFSGHLELVTNKPDFDFSVALYELTASGKYLQLPPFQSRASHVSSLTERRLLRPGVTERIDFTAIRLTAHRVRAGSRVVAVLGVIRIPTKRSTTAPGRWSRTKRSMMPVRLFRSDGAPRAISISRS